MLNKKSYSPVAISIAIGIAIFIAVIVLTNLVKLEQLPLQTIGALFGAVITALITYFLLIGQSQADEKKEKTVKIFEKRTESYENFINKLWQVWEDRRINPEELNYLLESLTKDILLYSSKKTTDGILAALINISEGIGENGIKIDFQNEVFNILELLVEEIGLGGVLDKNTRQQLNQLEEKILPHIIKKKYLHGIMENLKNNQIFDFGEIYYGDDYNYLSCQVGNSKVQFHIDGFENRDKMTARFYVNKNFAEYNKYREGKSGQSIFKQETIKDSQKDNWESRISFTDYMIVKEMNFEFLEKDFNEGNQLASEIITFCENWTDTNDLNIWQIVEECESNASHSI